MRSEAYRVRVPHRAYPAFQVECTVLDRSLMVWCGVAPSAEHEDDPDVVAAMHAAGRDVQPAIDAHLSHEWGVAMNRGGSGTVAVRFVANQTTTGTSLYSTHTAAVGMAQRIGTSRD